MRPLLPLLALPDVRYRNRLVGSMLWKLALNMCFGKECSSAIARDHLGVPVVHMAGARLTVLLFLSAGRASRQSLQTGTQGLWDTVGCFGVSCQLDVCRTRVEMGSL